MSVLVLVSKGDAQGSSELVSKASQGQHAQSLTQHDGGEGPACSAVAMDPKPFEARGGCPLTLLPFGFMVNAEDPSGSKSF